MNGDGYISLGILSILVSKYSLKLKNGEKPNFSRLSIKIEQEAANLGIELNEITNLSRDLSKSYKAVKNLLDKKSG